MSQSIRQALDEAQAKARQRELALPLELQVSERAFQRWVTDYAEWRHWLWFHDMDSRRNKAGLPDLILVRGGRLVLVELKTELGRLRASQRDWLAALKSVEERAQGAVEVYVWRPSDRPSIERILA